MNTTTQISGLSDLQRKLEELPEKMAKQTLRTTLKSAGEVVRVAMASSAPVRTGFLSRHFGVRVSMKNNALAGSAFIGPAGKIDYPLRNGGYKKNFRKGRRAKKLIGRIPVATVARFLQFGTSKMAANPFMTRAWNGIKQAALSAIVNGLKQSLP